jgi:vacuolar protein sorting-associated protein 13A/C
LNRAYHTLHTAESSTFTSQLISKIVENVQISIHRVHLRYVHVDADRVLPGRPLVLSAASAVHTNLFAGGIYLEELSAVSADEHWHEAYIHEERGLTRKLLRLSNLSVYYDTLPPGDGDWRGIGEESASAPVAQMSLETTAPVSPKRSKGHAQPPQRQYLLNPVSGEGRYIARKRYAEGEPMHSLNLSFDDLAMSLDDQQYRSLQTLMRDISRKARNFRHLVYRPPKNITPMLDPRAWFRYAIDAVMSDVREHRRQWTWAFFARRREERLQYVECYVAAKGGLLAQSSSQENVAANVALQDLEGALSYEDVCFYRKLARIQAKKRQKALQDMAPAGITPGTTGSAADAAASTTIGWLSSFVFSSAPVTAQSTKSSGAALSSGGADVLTEEQLQNLYAAIDYDPNQSLTAPEYPPSVGDIDRLLIAAAHANSHCLAAMPETTGDHVPAQGAVAFRLLFPAARGGGLGTE